MNSVINFIWELIFLKEVLILAIVFSLLEYFFPLNKNSIDRHEKIQDLAWLYFNEHITPHLFRYIKVFFSFFLISLVSKISPWNKFQINGALAFCIIIIYKDLMFYIAHNISHRSPVFWRLHILHHSSTRIDWLAGFRGYWLDNIFFDLLMGSIFIFIHVSDKELHTLMIFELTWVYFIHCNVNFKLGFLEKWINSPRTHHWHHSLDFKCSKGQNFGAYTLIWDRIFKTYFNDGTLPTEYGIYVKTYPSNFLKRLIYPFKYTNDFKQ